MNDQNNFFLQAYLKAKKEKEEKQKIEELSKHDPVEFFKHLFGMTK